MLAVQARLSGQGGLGVVQVLQQRLLRRGNVVDTLRHHAGQFLEAREAVELERVELAILLLGQRLARQHLRFRLDLDFPQLVAQADDVLGEIEQRALEGTHFAFDATAGDRYLAGLVDQLIHHVGSHAQHGPRRAFGFGGAGGLHRWRCRDGRRDCRGRSRYNRDDRWRRLDRCHCRFARLHLFQQHLDAVERSIQRVEECRRHGPSRHGVLDARFHAMHQLADAHGSRHAGAALERVQQALEIVGGAELVRLAAPLAQSSGDAMDEVGAFLEEHWQQLRIEFVGQTQLPPFTLRGFRGRHDRRGRRRDVHGRWNHRAVGRHGGRRRRDQRIELVGQCFLELWHAPFGNRTDHALEGADGARQQQMLGIVGGRPGFIKAVERHFEGMGDPVDRDHARGGGNAGQGVGGADHGAWRRCAEAQVVLERRQMLPGLGEIKVEQCRRERELADANVLRFRGWGLNQPEHGRSALLHLGLRLGRCRRWQGRRGRRLGLHRRRFGFRRRLGRHGRNRRFSLQSPAGFDQRRGVVPHAFASLQPRHPVAEQLMRLAHHVEQGRRRFLLHLQPAVEGLLDRPGGVAEFRQADHAAAAFQGVEAAPDSDQGLAIVPMAFQLRQLGEDVGEYLVGFLDENPEQLGIDLFRAGLGQPHRFGRGRRRGCCRCDLAHGLFDGFERPRCRFVLDGLDGGASLPGEGGIVDQFGVVAHGLEALANLAAQCMVLGLVAQGADQVLRQAPRLAQFRFRRGLRRLGGRRRRRTQERIDVGRPVLQLVDKEAQCRQLARHGFEIGVLRRLTFNAIGETSDGGFALAQHLNGARFTQHRQRPFNLLDRFAEA